MEKLENYIADISGIDCNRLHFFDESSVVVTISGGARSRNLGGHLRGNTHLGGGGQDRISRNLPSPSLPKF